MAAARPALMQRLTRATVAVVAAHVLVLWLLSLASAPRLAPFTGESRRIMVTLRMQAPPPPPQTPAVQPLRRDTAPPASRATAATRPLSPQTARRVAGAQSPATVTDPASPSAPEAEPLSRADPSSAAAPAPLRMQLDRQTLRKLDRNPSSAAGLIARDARTAPSGVDSQMARGMAGAARGDCMRGEFKGQGMGLLSLPMLALAYAKEECSTR